MRWGLWVALLLVVAPAAEARAFCGFYVGGANASLYNDATMVVLMRDGTKTVLSMQNDYQGPPEGFALVVPVPEVLSEENVRTLPKSIFERVDQLAAPRLVEYWEQDPCYRPPRRQFEGGRDRRLRARGAPAPSTPMMDQETRVTIEAEFAVGEYDIVILSAEDSSGLETWLRREDYAMPEGAGQALAPYVRLGTKFFVAKVDPARVTFSRGRALLSPLRVHYDAETFALPVRLGLLNARGKQDLLVHILAKNARYDVANYPNVFIPTNLVVNERTERNFGGFYRSLFDEVSEANEGAVVTEYSWQATSCDPCPTTPLQPPEIALLGGDVIDGMPVETQDTRMARRPFAPPSGWTLTRLHHRYDADDLDHDLVFRQAEAVIGGRGIPDASGQLREQVASQPGGGTNQFQGRYVMLHRWRRPIRCENPVRGRWGGPPGRGGRSPFAPIPRPAAAPSALREPRSGSARNLEPTRFVRRADHRYLAATATPAVNAELDYAPDAPRAPEAEVAEPVEEAPEEAEAAPEPTPQPVSVAQPVDEKGCASCAVSAPEPWSAVPLAGALLLMARRRRR